MKKVILIPALLLAFASIFAQNLSAQATGFQGFLAQFQAATLPYEIKADALDATVTTVGEPLGWEYYEYLPELERSAQFSRMPVSPEPVAVFETEQFYAFLYNIARGANTQRTLSITVFDKDGNYIATNFVAGINEKSVVTANISANLKATVTVAGKEKTQELTIDLLMAGNPDQIDWSAVSVKEVSGMATAEQE